MALENVAELAWVLRRRERLGKVFARHAYGMRQVRAGMTVADPHAGTIRNPTPRTVSILT